MPDLAGVSVDADGTPLPPKKKPVNQMATAIRIVGIAVVVAAVVARSLINILSLIGNTSGSGGGGGGGGVSGTDGVAAAAPPTLPDPVLEPEDPVAAVVDRIHDGAGTALAYDHLEAILAAVFRALPFWMVWGLHSARATAAVREALFTSRRPVAWLYCLIVTGVCASGGNTVRRILLADSPMGFFAFSRFVPLAVVWYLLIWTPLGVLLTFRPFLILLDINEGIIKAHAMVGNYNAAQEAGLDWFATIFLLGVCASGGSIMLSLESRLSPDGRATSVTESGSFQAGSAAAVAFCVARTLGAGPAVARLLPTLIFASVYVPKRFGVSLFPVSTLLGPPWYAITGMSPSLSMRFRQGSGGTALNRLARGRSGSWSTGAVVGGGEGSSGEEGEGEGGSDGLRRRALRPATKKELSKSEKAVSAVIKSSMARGLSPKLQKRNFK